MSMKLQLFDDDKAFVILHELEDLGAFRKLIDSDPTVKRMPWRPDSVLDLCARAQELVRKTTHGALGPDHAGTVTVDYTYQAEMHVQDMHKSRLSICRWELWNYEDGEEPDHCASWQRKEGKIYMSMQAEWYDGEWQLGVEYP